MKLNRFNKYFIFAKNSILEFFAYRLQVYSWTVFSIIRIILTMILWKAVYFYSGNNVISGFTLVEMYVYLVISLCCSSLAFGGNTFYILSDDIVDGKIATSLIKPIDYRTQLFFENIGAYIANFLFNTLPIGFVSVLILVLGYKFPCPEWYNIVIFIISSFLSCILYDCFAFIFGQIAFVTTSIFGVSQIMDILLKFLSGAIIPLAIFPQWARNIMVFLPFASLVSDPVRIFMGRYDGIFELGKIIILQLFWIILLYLIGRILYHKSLKHVVSHGG